MGLNLKEYGWSNVKAVESRNFAKLPAGAYVCRIVDARIENLDDKGTRIVLDVDVAEGEFAGFFNQHKLPNDNWNYNAQFKRYVLKKTVSGFELQGSFKGLIKRLEEENPNFHFNYTNVDETSLRGLTCGFIFAEREYVSKENSIKTAVSVKYPAKVADVREGKCKIPPLEKLPPDKRPDNQDNNFGFDGNDISDNDMPF